MPKFEKSAYGQPGLKSKSMVRVRDIADPPSDRRLGEADILQLQETALEKFGGRDPQDPENGKHGPTTAQQKEILKAVKRGGKVSLAMERAGIPKQRLQLWFKKAEEGNEKCINFFRQLAMELAEFEIQLVERVIRGGNGISGALTLLQKVSPERWGDNSVAALIRAARGEAKATVNQTSVHIYLPDNGRGAKQDPEPGTPDQVIDITPK